MIAVTGATGTIGGDLLPLLQRADVRVRALSLAFVHGASSHEISEALGGRPTPREIDRLAGRLRRRMARRGIDLPRRFAPRQGLSQQQTATQHHQPAHDKLMQHHQRQKQ